MKRLFMKSKKKQISPKTDHEQGVDPDFDVTLEQFKKAYFYPVNTDFTVRNLHIGGINKRAAIVFINTITDIQVINEFAIDPLIKNQEQNILIEDIITIQSMETKNTINDATLDINNGNAALIIEGESKVYILNASNFEGRSVEKPDNESVVKGPKEAFNEKVFTNISLVRKRIRDKNLIVESSIISKRSKNMVYMLYLKDIANEKLLDNVRERVNALDTDAIQNLSLLEQYIEERKYSIFPSVLYTERPDRAVSFLEDGYIVLLMENSPDCLVLPATFWSFFHSAEDHYLRFPYGNFTRILRMLSFFITIFTSAIYVAVVTYHIGMIPPDLLLAIAATREKVPFPALVEIVLMEIAFELIREAGLRVPTPIGPTIGIVGALILGQAAVQANLVSPIVVIVVALGGLSSFAVGDISMNFTVRLIRFLFIFAAGLFGIYGMTAVFVMGMFYMVSLKSFGVPYLSPLTPSYQSSKDTLFRRAIPKEALRPGYLKPKDIKKR
ncbi:spore germination protein [Oceanobacillus sp. Castelsardo]|uniref:spore germination protein n=1 Tax=Oceanobacillus sp. Castelsardo TaxID=1851204 RepID=UPI000838DB28|nr:spore germination protein [Oceanobacillus sp. Castelsardo]